MGYDTSYDVTLMESNASRRLIYFSVMSRTAMGTPVTTMAGSVVSIYVGHSAARAAGATLVAENSTLGLYSLQLAQSECSVMGSAGMMCLLASSNTAIPTTAYITIKALDSGDSTRAGLVALPNAAVSTASGLLVLGTGTGGINTSGGSVGIVPGTLSGVSVEVKSSGIVVASMAKGNYSGVSQEILTGGIQVTSIAAGTYSGVTFGINNIAAGAYSGVTVDGAKFLSTAGERSAASSLLSTNMGNAHLVQEALFALRNKVDASSSVMTVYAPDDSTSAWTASLTTGANPIASIAPTP